MATKRKQMKINSKQLVAKLAPKVGLSTQDAENAFGAIFEIIKEELAHGNEIEIKDFGKLLVKTRPAHVGRNPKTGESMNIVATIQFDRE